MNALGMYLAITSVDRDHDWADVDARAASLARAEARLTAGREAAPRLERLAGFLRGRRRGRRAGEPHHAMSRRAPAPGNAAGR
jgi:hypothetical protein